MSARPGIIASTLGSSRGESMLGKALNPLEDANARKPEVHHAIDVVEHELNELEILASTLEQRLEPVSQAIPPSDPASSGYSYGAPIAQRAEIIRARLASANVRLQAIVNRLEI